MPVTGSLVDQARQALKDLEQQAIEIVKDAARVSLQEFMDRTPVWSGKTCGSYAWGVGGGGNHNFEGGPTSKQAPTSKMALPDGEPNRPAAEDSAKAAMEGEIQGFRALGLSLVMTNTSPIWDLVDSGSAPTPERARNPGGVSALAEQSAKAKLGDNFK
jgi:hypothetical protein